VKFNPLILTAGAIVVLALVGLIGWTIEFDGGNAEQAVPRVMGLLLGVILVALVIKRIVFRQR